MKNWHLYLASVVIFVGCQSSQIKTQKRTGDKPVTTGSMPTVTEAIEVDDSDVEVNPSFPPAAPVPIVTGPTEKFALILGPGGALTMGHIGALRQFQKLKVEPRWIVGVEWASPWAALYSIEGTSQLIDWQLNKIKDSDLPGSSGWLSSGESKPVKNYSNWMNEAFQNRKAEASRVGFMCPSFNTQKKTTYLMNRGELKELVQFCWPFPPTLKSAKGAVAAPMALSAVVQYLRRQGAQKIILVNVMGEPEAVSVKDEDRDLMWAQIYEEYSFAGARSHGVDDVITLDLKGFKPGDFKRRKEIIEAGERKSLDPVQKIVKKYKL